MRTLFFGTSEFAVPSLRVVAADTTCAGVVTQPDRPAGRGHRLRPSPVKAAALELGLHVHEPLKLRAFAGEIAQERFDFFVLASYGRVLPPEVLVLPARGSLNVHPSLLPRYRGATPIQSALLHGDVETGVSIMLMDAGLDTGDVVASRRVAIESGESYGELHDRLALAGAQLLERVLEEAQRGELQALPQQGDVSLTRPLAREDLIVDLAWPAERIVRAVRAYGPQPAARAEIEGESVKLLRAHVDERGELVIDELVAPNRGRMSGETYLRSKRRTIGEA
ncbi:MAG TPA: methionyl-tRNA formyltransferase [Candidatus Cybelea sp.]|nr:methionyl-tRNA formyltransferase [Candidatus Cybelea sp.]